MRCSRMAGPGPRSRAWRNGVLLLAAALVLSACAQSNTPYRYQSNVGADPEQRVATAAPPRIVNEDDGLPQQHPPLFRRGPVNDDPSEPFSPNYGPPPLDDEAPPVRPAIKRQAQFTPAEVEAIIARAITQHELRTQ